MSAPWEDAAVIEAAAESVREVMRQRTGGSLNAESSRAYARAALAVVGPMLVPRVEADVRRVEELHQPITTAYGDHECAECVSLGWSSNIRKITTARIPS